MSTGNTLSKLKSDKATLLAEAQSMVNAGIRGEARESYNLLLKKIDGVQEHIDSLEKLERMQGNPSFAVAAPAPVAAPVNPSPVIIVNNNETPEARRHRLNIAWRSFLKDGFQPYAPEQRDLAVDSTGAAFVSQEFDSAITSALKHYGPIGSLVKKVPSGDQSPRTWKTVVTDDTASTMSYLNETGNAFGTGGGSSLEEDPSSIASEILNTDALVTLVKFSANLERDAFDLDSFLRDIAGIRVARAIEYALTLGKDNGTTSALPNSPTGGLLANVPVAATQTALADFLGYQAALITTQSAVDYAYRNAPNAGYMTSPSGLDFLLNAIDGMGRPIFDKFDSDGNLLVGGKPVYVNNAMPAITAPSSNILLFGDFSRAYAYIDGNVRIKFLRERFADINERAALIYTRIGAANLVSGAVKAFRSAAS